MEIPGDGFLLGKRGGGEGGSALNQLFLPQHITIQIGDLSGKTYRALPVSYDS